MKSTSVSNPSLLYLWLDVIASFSRFVDPVTDAKEKEILSKAIWTDWACSRLISPADQQSRSHYWICLQLIWLTGWETLCANYMAMSIWFALLERYDIRSTFDETIIWIRLRYRYVHLRSKLSLFLQTKKRCMLWSSQQFGTLTTHETSQNDNIQLSNTFQLCLCTYSICLYYYYACIIIIIIMMTFRFNLLVLWLFDKKKCALTNLLSADHMISSQSAYLKVVR